MCPAIRKMEEILPYHLELIHLYSVSQDDIIMAIDSFRFHFWEYKGNQMVMINLSTDERVVRLTYLGPEQAAEKFLLYNLSREGTRIKNVKLTVSAFCCFFFSIKNNFQAGPEFISKCIPIAIKNLNVFKNSSEFITDAWFPTSIPIENVEIDTTLREDTVSCKF